MIKNEADRFKLPLYINIENEGRVSVLTSMDEHKGREIPTGTYTIGIAIEDIYDRENVHPLMRNYRDWQNYYLTFTIPWYNFPAEETLRVFFMYNSLSFLLPCWQIPFYLP